MTFLKMKIMVFLKIKIMALFIIGCILTTVLSLCWICYIYEFYIGLYIISSLVLFLLLVLNISYSHKILIDYCVRKNINLNNILFIKLFSFLFVLFSLIMTLYILCLSSRVFIIIHNISIGTLVGSSIFTRFLSLSYAVIILILVVSTTLSWINVFNDKVINGKLNIWFVTMACFGSFLLGLNVFLALGIINLSYVNPILLSAISSYILELVSYFETSSLFNIKFSFNFNFIPNFVYPYYNQSKSYLSDILGTFWHKYCVYNYRKVNVSYYSNPKFGIQKILGSWSKGNIFQRFFLLLLH